ncbi:MAG: hypothetical protein IJY14_04160 [Acholeplasmatales bacterium]|nr:hypothetical protein [Acholeplasmatales bacterium]
MDTYIGENTRTMHAKIMVKSELFTILYTFIGLLISTPIFGWFISLIINKSDMIVLIILGMVLILLLLSTCLLLFIINIIFLIKYIKIIVYYKHNRLINIKEVIIEYDYKKWLNAPKKTFLSMGLYIKDDEKEVYYDAGRCFTNNDTYYKLPKFKIPKELIPKNYTEAYTIVGFDPNGNAVVIGYKKF